jgi:hypothetical protein
LKRYAQIYVCIFVVQLRTPLETNENTRGKHGRRSEQ